MNIVKTFVFCLLLTPAFLPSLFSQNSTSAAAWSLDCSDGVEVELIGKGIQFRGPHVSLNIPSPATVNEIVVEAVCKYACPATVTFSTTDTTIVATGSPLPFPNSTFIPPARVYRTTLPGGTGASQVNLTGATSYYFMSMNAYVFRQAAGSGSASVASFVDKSFWQIADTFVLAIPKGTGDRNIDVRIPVTDLDNDPRAAVFKAFTANTSNAVTVSTFNQSLGASLNIINVLLQGVPAHDTVLTVVIESPQNNGDSFMAGGAIEAKISCDNNAPIALNDILNTLIGTTANGNVLLNDFDPDNNPLTVNTTAVTGPTNGTLSLNPDGTYTFTPNPGFVGTDGFAYQVCDNGSPQLCDTAFVTIEVRQNALGNDTPIANDDAFLTFTDQNLSSSLLANDSDPDGDSLQINTSPVSGPTNGSVVINPDGTFTYVPDPGFEGTDSFVYEVCDSGSPQLCDQATVTVTVIPDPNGGENNPPVALDDAANLFEGMELNGDVSLNDYDLNGDNLTYTTTPTIAPQHGQVSLNSDGTYTYIPDSGYVGPDYFVYEVCDDGSPSLCQQASVYLTVMPFNQAPIAFDDINTAFEDQPTNGNVAINDLDLDGDDLTVNTTPVSAPTNGTLVLNADGSYTYTANAGFIGTDVFSYEVCDNGTPGPLCDTAEVVVHVWTNTLGNDAPIANNDNASTLIGQAVSGNVLNNDFDPDNDPLVVNTTPVNGPANGTLVLNADGTFTYTPTPGFEGEDSFTYEVCDNSTPPLCDQATVSIRVFDDGNGNENDPPFANDDAFAIDEDGILDADLSPNDSDPNGDNLIYATTASIGPFHGTVTINTDGTFIYTPDAAYVGTDYFVYEVCDDGSPSLCSQATAYLSVLPVNQAPMAVDDQNDAFSGFPASGNLLANDIDPDLDPLNVSVTPITAPANGTLTINVDGSYTYTPDATFSGTDVFEYEVCDEGTPGPLCDTASVTVVVRSLTPGNQPPFANNDRVQTLPNTPVSGDMKMNDIDPNGDNLTVSTTPISGPANGTVVISLQGTFLYSPAPGFMGEDSFVYEVCDDGSPSLCDQATVTISVMNDQNGNENDPPFAADDFVVTKVGEQIGGFLEDNDSDPNGDSLIYDTTPVIQPVNGTVTINADGSFTYVPNAGFFGQDFFVYKVCDDGTPSLCAQASAYIIVMPENNSPIANPDVNLTVTGLTTSGNVLINDVDPDGDSLVVVTDPVVSPTDGTLILNADGTYTYTPDPNFAGKDTFFYAVCDLGLPGPLCDTTFVTIEVGRNTNGNDAPLALDDFYSTFEGDPVTGNLLNNDGDPDGDPITINTTAILAPAHGIVQILPNGSFLYLPDPNFIGEDRFVYEICDNGSPALCDQATVTVRISEDGNGSDNDPPFASDDAIVLDQNQQAVVNVLINDNDPNGDNLTVSSTLVAQPAHGTVTMAANGVYTYQPDPGYAGADYFVYEVCDDGNPSLCAKATVYVLVMPDPLPCVFLNLSAYLEGAYMSSTGTMRTSLNALGFLPGQIPKTGIFADTTAPGQPYNDIPWHYEGTEGDLFGDMPGGTPYPSTVVDWVLISLREGDSLASSEVWKQAALLHADGSIQTVGPCFQTNSTGPFWVLIEHRNHVGVMTPSPQPIVPDGLGNFEITFDFRTNNSFKTSITVGQKLLPGSTNIYVMLAGDPDKEGNENFEVNGNDNAFWLLQNGRSETYSKADMNLDVEINGTDRALWLPNNGFASGVPK